MADHSEAVERYQAEMVEDYGRNALGVVRQKNESLTAYVMRCLREAHDRLKPVAEAESESYARGVEQGRVIERTRWEGLRDALRRAAQQVMVELQDDDG